MRYLWHWLNTDIGRWRFWGFGFKSSIPWSTWSKQPDQGAVIAQRREKRARRGAMLAQLGFNSAPKKPVWTKWESFSHMSGCLLWRWNFHIIIWLLLFAFTPDANSKNTLCNVWGVYVSVYMYINNCKYCFVLFCYHILI